MESLTTVKSGETVTLADMAFLGPETVEVKPSCGNNRGYWYCITHGEGFHNNWAKDTHISKGKHKLAWMCATHGVEQP